MGNRPTKLPQPEPEPIHDPTARNNNNIGEISPTSNVFKRIKAHNPFNTTYTRNTKPPIYTRPTINETTSLSRAKKVADNALIIINKKLSLLNADTFVVETETKPGYSTPVIVLGVVVGLVLIPIAIVALGGIIVLAASGGTGLELLHLNSLTTHANSAPVPVAPTKYKVITGTGYNLKYEKLRNIILRIQGILSINLKLIDKILETPLNSRPSLRPIFNKIRELSNDMLDLDAIPLEVDNVEQLYKDKRSGNPIGERDIPVYAKPRAKFIQNKFNRQTPGNQRKSNMNNNVKFRAKHIDTIFRKYDGDDYTLSTLKNDLDMINLDAVYKHDWVKKYIYKKYIGYTQIKYKENNSTQKSTSRLPNNSMILPQISYAGTGIIPPVNPLNSQASRASRVKRLMGSKQLEIIPFKPAYINESIKGGSLTKRRRRSHHRNSRSSPPLVGRSQGLNMAKPHLDYRNRS